MVFEGDDGDGKKEGDGGAAINSVAVGSSDTLTTGSGTKEALVKRRK